MKADEKKYQAAIKKYGADVCRKAHHMCDNIGEGANTIAWNIWGHGKTRVADAAINAGRYLASLDKNGAH